MRRFELVLDDAETLHGAQSHCLNCGPIPQSVKVIEEIRGESYYGIGSHHRCVPCAVALVNRELLIEAHATC